MVEYKPGPVTHYEDCWRSRSHWRCAVARVERLEEELAECRKRPVVKKRNSPWRLLAEAQAELAKCQKHAVAVGQYRRQMQQRLAELAEDARQWDKHSLVEIVEERNDLRKRLAAAEARQREALRLLREAEKNARPGGLMDRILGRIDYALHKSDHAALDAALEQRAIEMLEFAQHLIVRGVGEQKYFWTESMMDAMDKLMDIHEFKREHARAEERERIETVIAKWRDRELNGGDGTVAEVLDNLLQTIREADECAN